MLVKASLRYTHTSLVSHTLAGLSLQSKHAPLYALNQEMAEDSHLEHVMNETN